jgi:hypothetical protein
MVIDVMLTMLQQLQHQSWQAAATRFTQSNWLSQQLRFIVQQQSLNGSSNRASNRHGKVSISSISSISNSNSNNNSNSNSNSNSNNNSNNNNNGMQLVTASVSRDVKWSAVASCNSNGNNDNN